MPFCCVCVSQLRLSKHSIIPQRLNYCLLGIFGVNLPLVYGEGARAFTRLQEAIAQSTNDLSLFAWFGYAPNSSSQTYSGVLAQSPRQFASESCRRLELIADPLRHDATAFTITNRGVEFQTSLIMDFDTGDYLMHLDCCDTAIRLPEGPGVIAIRLVKTSSGFARHHADRHHADRLHVDAADGSANPANPTLRKWDPFMRPVHVPQVLTPAQSTHLRGRLSEAFQFRVDAPRGVTWELVTQSPSLAPGSLRPSHWDPATSAFLTEGYEYFTGMAYITFSSHLDDPFVVLCGLMPPASASAGHPQEAGNHHPRAPPEPWVALHPLRPPPDSPWRSGFTPEPGPHAQNRVGDLRALISQGAGLHYPRSLARLGQTVRARIRSGKASLPSMALMKYRERSRSTPPPACYRLVKVSVTTRSADRVHEVLISMEDQLSWAKVSEQCCVRVWDESTGWTHGERG
ncbi:hypothetical protein C8A01DRAFT_17497 [Parachaetomium inaequale]|uniref:DUF8212 domain-containing protein n=1 Tax=Parachaetomium inaequale TaxID=2588326 RepID=A0AAN6SQ23_9PEZI|nr:hypothetical protein C8A01DRAFT_17497 [Parachaetomium inaequale]